MAQRTVSIADIGEVLLAKRRGARNIRLSVTPSGKVRVGLPAWAPYSAGISFAKNHREWIEKQLAKQSQGELLHGDQIGKYHRLSYSYSPAVKKTFIRLRSPELAVISNLPLDTPAVQTAVAKASERALRAEAENLLPQRLDLLSHRHGFKYRDLKIRKLTSRWGSCSSTANIRLSYYLIQLPWELIDYVLIHELVHTQFLSHDKEFWDAFTEALPEAKMLQKKIRAFQPRLISVKGIA